MVETPIQIKYAKWIRALIGGSVSALIVGMILFLLSPRDASSEIELILKLLIGLPGIYLYTWLFGDPFAKLLPAPDAWDISLRIIGLALVYWFLAGFGLTYFIKSNRKAIGGWFIMIVIQAIVLIVLS